MKFHLIIFILRIFFLIFHPNDTTTNIIIKSKQHTSIKKKKNENEIHNIMYLYE